MAGPTSRRSTGRCATSDIAGPNTRARKRPPPAADPAVGRDSSTRTGEIISIEIQGPRTLIAGQGDRYTVVANTPDGPQIDVTTRATFSSSDPSVADVDRDGRVAALAEGSTTIAVTADGLQVAFRLTILPGS